MQDAILILDFGSQYTQLIARRVRELQVYCEIHPYNNIPSDWKRFNAVILSGSPYSTQEVLAPKPDIDIFLGTIPVLGVCYGAQYIAKIKGGKVASSQHREYGRAKINGLYNSSKLLKGIPLDSSVWMSHGDTIVKLPKGARIECSTPDVEIASFKLNNQETYGIQYHPEVHHTEHGILLLKNFVYSIANCSPSWTPAAFVKSTMDHFKKTIGEGKVVLGLSGGVDSTVAAVILSQAIGDRLFCIFVNNGLLRKNEFDSVLDRYKGLGLNVKGVDASSTFLSKLVGVEEPEEKRKIIG
ncbi:glutamine-hydrolyzing GMP synthase, partial [Schleiferiaceae bacterium]|nr:glutamine-hydrolyzing GMP synthase [Schleiferiaceae bacterium]